MRGESCRCEWSTRRERRDDLRVRRRCPVAITNDVSYSSTSTQIEREKGKIATHLQHELDLRRVGIGVGAGF